MPTPGRSVLVDGLGFAEGPRWRDGRLYFSDIGDRRVFAVDLDGWRQELAHVEGRPSGLGWLPDGRMLIVSMDDRRVLRLEPDGRLVEHADLSRLASATLNDMAVDGRGNAYVGNWGYDIRNRPEVLPPAELILVRPDGTSEVVDHGCIFPNGAVVSPDDRTLIFAETFGHRLTAFDIAEDGTLSGRRLFADLPARTPDGIALDAEGGVWVTDTYGNECIRVLDGGEVTDSIPTEPRCFACALGGPDGRTLFILTADEFSDAAFERRTGAIEMLTVDVPAAGALR